MIEKNNGGGRGVNTVSTLECFIMRFVSRISGKRLLQTKYFKIYTDGGQPMFRYFPSYMRMGFAEHWGMRGIAVFWLGRGFHFVFGEDTKGLYKTQLDQRIISESDMDTPGFSVTTPPLLLKGRGFRLLKHRLRYLSDSLNNN